MIIDALDVIMFMDKYSIYYSSLCDIDQQGKGEDYNKLKNIFIIFICTFDLFGLSEGHAAGLSEEEIRKL